MRRICKIASVILMMAVVALGLTTCKKEAIAPPTVKLFGDGQPSSVSITSASVSAEVSDQGGAEVKSRGFAYGISGGAMDTIFCSSGTGAFSAELTGLQPNTTYVYEAFAKNAGGYGTSGKVTFTTRDYNMATVKTNEVENVSTTSATCGGNVTNDGGAEITERGVWHEPQPDREWQPRHGGQRLGRVHLHDEQPSGQHLILCARLRQKHQRCGLWRGKELHDTGF